MQGNSVWPVASRSTTITSLGVQCSHMLELQTRCRRSSLRDSAAAKADPALVSVRLPQGGPA